MPELAYDLNQPDPFNPVTGEIPMQPRGIEDAVRTAFAFPGAVAPGLYFNMPESVYHAIPALSAGGCKNLRVSSMDFWARSWLNGFKEQDSATEDSEAKEHGHAYHKRLLEGAAAFRENFAPEFICDNPKALKTNDDLKEALAKAGVTTGLSGKKKADLIDILKKADPAAVIYEELEAAYLKTVAGKTLIDWSTVRRIELAAAMIDNHPKLKYFFKGGYPEVTCVWEDEEHGVLYKVRFDYLKTRATNDLKSFANPQMKKLEKAIYSAMTNNKYVIPGALYLRGCDEAKNHVRAGTVTWWGEEGGNIPGNVNAIEFKKWLDAFAASEPHDMNFVFQQKGIAPVTKSALFSRQDEMYQVGLDAVRESADMFKTHWKQYGADPWIDMSEEITLVAGSYPIYAYEV